MTQTVEELAADIVKTIEREDFIYSVKHYTGFKITIIAKKIVEWCYRALY